MNICFLCGSFELERSGVADYCGQLASECHGFDQHCVVLAVNDPHITEPTRQDYHWGTSYRLPTQMPLNQRRMLATTFLDECEVEWVSLQLVCYDFAYQGILFPILPLLSELCRGRKVHCFFHEVWIGMYNQASWKSRIIGALQYRSIRKLLAALKPRCTHAACQTYIDVYRKHEIYPEHLPLFSSMPRHKRESTHFVVEKLRTRKLLKPEENLEQIFLAVIFGSLNPQHWSAKPLAIVLDALARQRSQPCVLVAIGHEHGDLDLSDWRAAFAPFGDNLRFARIGGITAPRISTFLSLASVGITTTPFTFIDRSAATETMLDHGLPVISVRDSEYFPGYHVADHFPGVTKLSAVDPSKGIEGLATRTTTVFPGQIAAQFINSLVKAGK